MTEESQPRKQLKANKSRSRIKPTDSAETNRQLFGLLELNDDDTIGFISSFTFLIWDP